MRKLQEIEWAVLNCIHHGENQAESAQEALIAGFHLKETEQILRIRELVQVVEGLISEGLVEASGEFYESSDKLSFQYMNAATSITLSRLSLTENGNVLAAAMCEKKERTLGKQIAAALGLLFNFSFGQVAFILLLMIASFLLGYYFV